MTCAKCGQAIADGRARVAVMLGDGRAALDWPCFERMLKPERAAYLMRLVRAATTRAGAGGAIAVNGRGGTYQGEPE